MTTEKSPRGRFDVFARAEEAGRDGKSEGGDATGKPLAEVSHAASLDEETNIPGSDLVPPPRGDDQKGGGKP